jgi:nucleoside-diphosphate-sugar epimerase
VLLTRLSLALDRSFCGSDAWECPREQRPKNGVAFNEDDWATTLYPDGGLAYKDNQAYCRSKVEQEKAAREFADLNGLDLVTIHPALAVGPPRGPRDDGVSMYIMKAMAAGTLINPGFPHGDTRDVALAHIKAATIPEASGRYLVTTPHIPTDHELWTCLKQAYPAMELGSEPEVAEPHWFRASSKRTEELFGHALTPLCKSWVDAVGTIIQKGYAVNEGLKDLKSEL